MFKISSGLTSIFSLALVAAVGCGEDRAKFTDAPPTTVDAPTAIDAIQAGVVKVKVERAIGPAGGIAVAFQNADDSVVASAPGMTDVNGVAMATMNPGGSVTVVLPPLPGPAARPIEVYTFIGVKPGDELLVGRPANAVVPAAVNLKIAPLLRGSNVEVQTSCGGSFQGAATINIPLQISSSCTTVDVFVSARTISNTEIGTFYKANVAVVGGNIDAAAEIFKVSKVSSFTLNNIPATTISALISANVSAGTLSQLQVPETANINFPTPLGTSRTGDIVLPDIAGDVLLTTQTSRTTSSIQSLFVRAPLASVAPLTVDLTAQQIPWVLSLPLFDIGGSQFAWTESSDGTADTVIVTAQVARPAVPPATQGETWLHRVIAPHTVGLLHIPVLPAALSNFNFKSTDTVTPILGLAKFPGGFDAVRARFFVNDGITTLLPSGGNMAISQFFARRTIN